MSIEKKAESLAVSMFDRLESNTLTRTRVYTAAGGGVVTIVMWVVHLLHPEIFNFFFGSDDWLKLFLGVVLAPPFVMAFSLGSFIYPQPVEPERTDASGPMSGYFYRERAGRRWKLIMASGLIAAVNFLLMLVTAMN
jgi:uncharacterized integral membrane protein